MHWKTAVAKMSTANLIRPYLADKGNEPGKALKKSNPLIYTGGDSRMRILTYPSTGNLKYGFYSLYQVPTIENSLKTFHSEPKPSTYIWVDKNGYDYEGDLRVFSGIKDKKHQDGRTHELLLKYTGNNCYTISTTDNPYHFFEPKNEEFWDHSSNHAIYARKKPLNADYRWNRWVMFQDSIHKDDTEAIYFKWFQEYPAYGSNGMFASRDWPDTPEPLYYSQSVSQWGATHQNDLRKLFPEKHGTEWQFD